MSNLAQVVWWKIREHFGARWVGIGVATLAVFLCALGWVEVTVHKKDEIDLGLLVRSTAEAMGVAILAAGALAGAVMWRYRYQVPDAIAKRGVVTFLRTLQVLGIVGIVLGIFVYGGRFLHMEILLKLFGIAKGG